MKKLSNRGKVTILLFIVCIALIVLLGVLEANCPTVNLGLREELKWITDLI